MENRNVFDYVKSINNKKEYLGDDLSGYSSYIVSKALSAYPDTIMLVNEIKLYPTLTDKMEYDFYYYSISKSNRYADWYKKDRERFVDIMKFYNVSYKKAQEIAEILTEDQLQEIHNTLTVGVKD